MKRRIAVITGTRAEYGLLRSTINALQKHNNVEMQLVVTGMHLLKRYGFTMKLITDDGVPIAAEVPIMEERDDDRKAMATTVSRGIKEMSAVFQKLDPEIVLVLGDRVETFGAGVAAALTGRVLAHIHGGDVTRGGYDESMRHALTKFAHIHFPATPGAMKRILQMGEEPAHVHLTGAPGVDELLGADRASKDEIEKRYK
ncbi:MAG: UDP-N-acetylglucosamine 2-epimerase, partial [Planctomycetes bacterium]|nr:UDP-N-acetylglucosamine 2-epimerase [Planctomycetota bacterium]